MSKTQPASPFKGGEPVVHHERAARALDRLGILCYDVAKPMKECGCQETVFTNSLVGTKTGGRPMTGGAHHSAFTFDLTSGQMADWAAYMGVEAVVLDSTTNLKSLRQELAMGQVLHR